MLLSRYTFHLNSWGAATFIPNNSKYLGLSYGLIVKNILN